jgi:class 3 adenylate cyclase/tetratricopeptide (TPR) repeat protein|nr:adenylate/guanylate cyclase domain-containing protein [Rhodoferax sp.]
MTAERLQLEATIATLEAQRSVLGDAVVDLSVASLRATLAGLTPSSDAALDKGEQAIRQATILFLDIVGSTPLSLQLDPEEFHAIVDGVLRRGTKILVDRGGKIISYAGDNIIAVFGANEASEDAVERAVHAGLELLEVGHDLQAQVQTRFGLEGSHVRVGIHTGSVLLGGGVQADSTISGLSVNVAARMEQTAPPGGLRISQTTYSMVRGVFDVEAQAPMAVKGIAQPMLTYLVLRAKPRAFRVTSRGVEGVETRMIARDSELEEMQDTFLRLCQQRRMEVVLVVAEAGLGKSRLLYEFDNWADLRPEVFTIFRACANPQSQTQPYGLLRDIFAWRYQLLDSDSMQEAKSKFETALSDLFADEGSDFCDAQAHLLGQLIGLNFGDSRHVRGILDDAKQIRNRAFHAAAQVFRRIALQTGNPVVLELDDLHWADDASLDFLNYLTQVNRDVPLMVIGLTRATIFERRADWSSTDGFLRRIDLEPLDKTGSRLLANELLKRLVEIPATLRELIIGGADGNPFYMEELVKMLIDQRAIETNDEKWLVNPEKLLSADVPPTLTGILQARLDGLPARERIALQKASVIGLTFWDKALGALDARATEALPALVQRGLTLKRDAGTVDDAHEFAFKHHILHQVTYETLLKSHKRELHARAAHWLANLTGARAGNFLGITAEHYAQAGDFPNAIEFYARAAEHARNGYVHESVLSYVAHALNLLDAVKTGDPFDLVQFRQRWRLLDVREAIWRLQGRRDAQRADQDAMQAVANALNDKKLMAELANRRAQLAMLISDFQTQEAIARTAIELANDAADVELRLKSQRVLSAALAGKGDTHAALELTRSGLSQAREQGLRRLEGTYLSDLSNMLFNQGQIVASMELMSQVLVINQEVGDRVNEANNVGNRGVSWLQFGALNEARVDIGAALEMSRAVGDRASEGAHLVNLSRLMLMQGHETAALAHARAGLDIAIATEVASWEVISLIYMGNAEMALGRMADARLAFLRAESIAEKIGNAWRFDALAGLARVALEAGELDEAVRLVGLLLDQMETARALDDVDLPRWIELTCYKVLDAAADPRAPRMLARAHDLLLTQANNIPDAALRQSFLDNIPEHREIVQLRTQTP